MGLAFTMKTLKQSWELISLFPIPFWNNRKQNLVLEIFYFNFRTHKSKKMKVGFKIKKLRESHNISQEELALRLGISQSKLSKIENGRLKTRFPLLVKVFIVFELSLDELAKFLNDFY